MFDAHLRFGRLRFEASISWDGPEEQEPDDGPPSPVPHLQPLELLQVEGLDDDGGDVEEEGLGFRG